MRRSTLLGVTFCLYTAIFWQTASVLVVSSVVVACALFGVLGSGRIVMLGAGELGEMSETAVVGLFLETLCDGDNVVDELLDHSLAEIFPDDYAEDVDVFKVRGEVVVGDDPAFGAQKGLHPALFEIWVTFAEVFGPAERDNGQTGSVHLSRVLIELFMALRR